MTNLSPSARRTVVGMGLVGAVVGAFFVGSVGARGWMYVVGAAMGAAVLGAAGYLAQRSKARRDAAFEDVALQRGWTHRTDVVDDVMLLVRGCIPYKQGHDALARQLLSGRRDGIPFHLIDGRYTTGSGKSQATHHVATVVVMMPMQTELTIRAETVGDKLYDLLGGEDIDVESDEFSRLFWVRSPDRRTAYDLLHPQAVAYLLQAGTGWTWHWTGASLVMTRDGPLEPEACMGALDTAWGFRSLVPRHLLAGRSP